MPSKRFCYNAIAHEILQKQTLQNWDNVQAKIVIIWDTTPTNEIVWASITVHWISLFYLRYASKLYKWKLVVYVIKVLFSDMPQISNRMKVRSCTY